jgi:thioredoxin 1
MRNLSRHLLMALPLALLVTAPLDAAARTRDRAARQSQAQPSPKKSAHGYGIPEIKTAEHYNRIKQGPKDALLIISADWCGACDMFKEPVANVANIHKDHAAFFWLNFDNKALQSILQELKVDGLPTRVYLKNGKVHKIKSGAIGEDRLHKEVSEFVGKESRTGEAPAPLKKARVTRRPNIDQSGSDRDAQRRQQIRDERQRAADRKQRQADATRLGQQTLKKLRANGNAR